MLTRRSARTRRRFQVMSCSRGGGSKKVAVTLQFPLLFRVSRFLERESKLPPDFEAGRLLDAAAERRRRRPAATARLRVYAPLLDGSPLTWTLEAVLCPVLCLHLRARGDPRRVFVDFEVRAAQSAREDRDDSRSSGGNCVF